MDTFVKRTATAEFRSKTDPGYEVIVLQDDGSNVVYQEILDPDNRFAVDKSDFMAQFDPVTPSGGPQMR